MKITILSQIDYAGSGHKLCQAISRFTDHDIKFFAGKYYNPYSHPDNSKWNRRQLQRRVDESDIIHLKGDFPPQNGYLGLKILHKPLITSVSGSHFRKSYHNGHERYHPWQFKNTFKTAFTPDLLYPEFSDIWTPHPIDSNNTEREWKQSDPPILMHMPTNKDIKGTDFILKVFDVLKEKRDVNIVLIEKVPHSEAIEAKKEATIFFDQFNVGFYGNSALEAMQFGVPVAAWISPEAVKQSKGMLEYCPVITASKAIPLWVDEIEKALDGNLLGDSIHTKMWCDTIHSYQSIANQWDEIYKSI